MNLQIGILRWFCIRKGIKRWTRREMVAFAVGTNTRTGKKTKIWRGSSPRTIFFHCESRPNPTRQMPCACDIGYNIDTSFFYFTLSLYLDKASFHSLPLPLKSMWPKAPLPTLTEEFHHKYNTKDHTSLSSSALNDDDDYIPGSFNCVDSKDPSEIIHVTRLPTGDDDGPHCHWNAITTRVWNARRLFSSNHHDNNHCPLLHVTGFDLVESKLPSHLYYSMDFLDSLQVVNQYYPTCESLVKDYLERSHCIMNDDHHHSVLPNKQNPCFVKAFDHNIRIQQDSLSMTTTAVSNNKEDRILKNGGGSKVQHPIAVVHGDYTHLSAPRRVQQLGEPPKTNDVLRLIRNHSTMDNSSTTACDISLLSQNVISDILEGKKRYSIINVWRSIDKEHVVSSFPLACCDTRTVRKDDLRTLQIHYSDRIGENYLVTHEDRHKWMYFPSMNFEEALLIKQWDSDGGIANGKISDDGSTSTFAIHSAFQTPLTSDGRPRQSIEVRCLCVWE